MTMWEWWGIYYHKALSLGGKFEQKFGRADAKEVMKKYGQWD